MLAARFDPEPWVDPDGTRHATGGWSSTYAPSPDFIPTRDPEPWVSWGVRYAARQNAGCYFDPRPEYARSELNPILAEFRRANEARIVKAYPTSAHLAVVWADGLGRGSTILTNNATPAQIEDARKVLTRLAALAEVS